MNSRKRPRGRPRLLMALALANLAFLLLLYLTESFIAEHHWLSAYITYLPQQVFGAPLLVLLVWSAACRNWRTALVNAAAAVFFVFAILGFNVPGNAFKKAASGGVELRVMTYNVRQGAKGALGLAEAIEKEQPDILCVQEVDPGDKWGDPVWQLQQLVPGWHVVRDGELAVLSRRPILDHKVHYLPAGTGRAVLQAVVGAEGTRVTVLTTHFNITTMERQRTRWKEPVWKSTSHTSQVLSAQMSELLAIARPIKGPLIITGDFNLPPRCLVHRRIAERYTDAFRAAGWGFGYTFRADVPVLRIDYVWLGNGVTARRCWVPSTRASDHRPVLADIHIGLQPPTSDL